MVNKINNILVEYRMISKLSFPFFSYPLGHLQDVRRQEEIERLREREAELVRQRFVQLQERFHQRQQQREREHETVMNLLPPPEPAQQQQQQQQLRGIPTSVIVRAPPRTLATTQLFPDVQPSTSGVQQSGQGKKRSHSTTTEPESQSQSPRSSPEKKQTKWIIASNEREAELRRCEKEFYEQQGEP